LQAAQQTNYLSSQDYHAALMLVEKRKREMIAERYRQFESAYSNFKGGR
jgi:hypothetical protein